MKLLVDTNVVLDVLLDRAPFAADSARVMAAAELGSIEAFLCATTLTTVHYRAAKALGRALAERHIRSLLGIFGVAPVTDAVLLAALQSKARDYEDAVLLESARAVGVEGIVTRNPSDFPKSGTIAIHAPADVVVMLGL